MENGDSFAQKESLAYPKTRLGEVFTYGYQANSFGLIASVTGPVYTVTNTWEGTRDVLDKKENKVGATNISTYDYSVNSIGQRSAVDVSGTAFSTQADWTWGYNGFGEIQSAQHVNTGDSSRYYAYDSIGNRVRQREKVYGNSGGDLTQYFSDAGGSPTAGANELNQYERITLPSSTNVDPTYDTDGNMTSGPIPNDPTVLATFTWDGENRLFSVTPNGGDTTSYVRDAMGRRVMKSITVSGTTTKTYFFYDGWNLIAEYSHITGTPVLKRTHVWGTDLSGSLQGAGGVGGLLATYLHNAGGDSGVYYPTYDGNGNVTEYLDGSGAVKVHLEYDPFGNPLVNTDTGNLFPIRFSTKYLDFESGLIHYGGRDYESFTGRWPSRDPIEEKGGVNLFGMVGNDPVNRWDYLGLEFTGTYSINEGTLKLVDNDRKKSFFRKDKMTCECKGSSGTNSVKDIALTRDKNGVHGPVPTGTYTVYDRGKGEYYRYVLDPNDSKPLNDQWDGRPDGISRNAFRIHAEDPKDSKYKGSDGCVVFNETDLQSLIRFIDGTKQGPKVTLTQEPNVVDPINIPATRVGTITVQ